MGIGSLLIFLIVGAIAGWLASKFVRGEGFGLIGNMIVGIIGAFVAGIVFPRLGFSIGAGFLGALLHATLGAVIFLFVIKLIKRV